jgi:hypothetical protein
MTHELALADFDEAIRIAPSFEKVHTNWGVVRPLLVERADYAGHAPRGNLPPDAPRPLCGRLAGRAGHRTTLAKSCPTGQNLSNL